MFSAPPLHQHLFLEDLAQLAELHMYARITTDNRDYSRIAAQSAQGEAELIQRHVPEPGLVMREAHAARALEVALVPHR